MRAALLLLAVAPLLGAQHPVPPREERGRAGADCRPNEPGPAALVRVEGMKDRTGNLRLELYPANDDDFLAPDRALIAAGKPFRRVEIRPPATGPVALCIRAPAPGRYALVVLHDRDSNGRFTFLRDGVGFPGNPRVRRSRPAASAAAMPIGPGVSATTVVLNYRRGFGLAPLR